MVWTRLGLLYSSELMEPNIPMSKEMQYWQSLLGSTRDNCHNRWLLRLLVLLGNWPLLRICCWPLLFLQMFWSLITNRSTGLLSGDSHTYRCTYTCAHTCMDDHTHTTVDCLWQPSSWLTVCLSTVKIIQGIYFTLPRFHFRLWPKQGYTEPPCLMDHVEWRRGHTY